ncbi:MAG TPA: tripartite tricarboxylate transporter substrate binding protein [Candidatus Methylomirabilis sp.]|nr:tripartite tricarboxylate transporter substrate binding protein [Candidatus Methylomirabilis sp.]
MLRRIGVGGLSVLFSLGMFTGMPSQAQSQEKYPSRAIDIVVPFNPGGSTDLSTRILVDFLKTKWGIAVNVINKPGGATVPANLEVYKARPDGYTLFADNTSSNVTLEIAIKDLPFKVMERTFVGMHSASPYIITVPTASPYATLKDLLEDLKKDPERFTYVSAGALANHDIIYRQVASALGVNPAKARPIVISGAAQAAVVTAGNSVKMGGGTVSSQLVAIKAGTIRAVAVAGKERWPELPNVPCTAELGYPTVQADQWNGISGPPKMSAAIVKTWENYLQEMAKDTGVVSKLKSTGAWGRYMGSEDLRKYVQNTAAEMKTLWEMK